MKKIIVAAVSALFFCLGLQAQDITVKGTVLDQDGLSVIGAAVIPGDEVSKGVMTDKQARAAKVGGEVLAYIW